VSEWSVMGGKVEDGASLDKVSKGIALQCSKSESLFTFMTMG
jgi:hypothetical protein